MFEGEDNRYVTAFVYKVGQDGKPMAFTGYSYKLDEHDVGTLDAGSLSKSAHEQAERYKARFDQNATIHQAYSDSPTLHNTSPSRGENWTSMGPYPAYASANKWGEVKISATISKYDTSELPGTEKQLWAQDATYRCNTLPCGGCVGDRVLQSVDIRQNWSNSRASLAEPYIDKTHPAGDITADEQVSKSGGIGVDSDGVSGELGWTYTKEVRDATMYDETDSAGNRNDAVWEYSISGDYQDVFQVRHGSRMWFDATESYPSRKKMGDNTCTANFDDEYTWGGPNVTANLNWGDPI
ncbi:hypothetical protein [Halorubellus sp. PRR65]|uniref:hypothetical protein n=1 Tax=Halorubellus sp. PRR65 TaxID=3098148 RepID=UPI002B25926E|nr:hypothetical protein [Halorubellus sp. PRR65]